MNQFDQERFFEFYYWYENYHNLGTDSTIRILRKQMNSEECESVRIWDNLQKQHIYMYYLDWKRKQKQLQKQQEEKYIEEITETAEKAIVDMFDNLKLS